MSIKKKYLIALMLLLGSIMALILWKYNLNEIGLKSLSFIKQLSGNDVNISALDQENKYRISHNEWTHLLQKYVSEKGLVDYRGIREDSIVLNQYLQKLSTYPPGSNWRMEEKMAYWINAYNAFTVKLIVNHYPLSSIKEISKGLPMINSPWDVKFFNIGGIPFDLNTIEHEILRKEFSDPRIHFAINCASISCPILRKEAYSGDQLPNQLEDQAFTFILDTTRNKINSHETSLSQIFNWFESDFTNGQSVKKYLEKYHPGLNPENPITYLTYDWSLNERE